MSWKRGWVYTADTPSGERPDNELPGGGYIDNDLPGGGYGGRPDNSLPGGGHIWGALIRWLQRPEIGGGPAKPPGLRPILPGGPGIDNGLPPNGGRPPIGGDGGHWEPIDPGYGKPPLWGWVGVDNGLPSPPVHIGGGPATPPGLHPGGGPIVSPPGDLTKPTPPGQGGAWYPTDPDFGKPVRPCPPHGGKPHPPIWAWVPDRPPVEGSLPEGTATVSPTSGTVLASGGTVTTTVYPSTSTPEWSVTALPAWVTASPMSGSGTGTVVLTAAVNTTGIAKQAVVKIGGASFTLNQGAV